MSIGDHVFWLEAPTISVLTNPIVPLPFTPLPIIRNPSFEVKNVHDLFSSSPYDSICRKFTSGRFYKKNTKNQALVSYPGSGSSWLRTTLMTLTGMFINTEYSQRITLGNDISGHFLPRDCGCTLLKETNDFSRLGDLTNMAKNGITKNALYTSVNQFNGDAIFLIRNPFEAIISYRNNAHHDAESFLSDKSLAKIEAWDYWVTSAIVSWETLAITWIGNLKRGGVVYYEKLVHHPNEELHRALKMLGMENIDENRLICTLKYNKNLRNNESATHSYK